MATKTFYVTKDAMMGKNYTSGFSGWNGHDNHLPVGASDNYKWRSVVYYSINFTGMTDISSATLHLVTSTQNAHHYIQTNAPSTLGVYRMTKDWGEGTADPGEGNLAGSGQWEWDNRFDQFATGDSNSRAITQGANGTEETVDITDIVNSWFNGSPNYGLMLKNNSSETLLGKALLFFAQEDGNANRSYVTINYTSNTAPDAPIVTAPIGGSVVNTLLPTFSGTRSDPDAGDFVTGVQIQVYPDSATDASPGTAIWDSGAISVSGSPTTFSMPFSPGIGPNPTNPLVGNTFYRWRAKTKDKGGLWSTAWSALDSATTPNGRFKVNSTPNAPSVTLLLGPSSDIPDNTPDFLVTHSDNDPGDSNMYGYEVIVDVQSGASWNVFWDTGNVDTSGAPVSSVTVTSATLAWGSTYRVRARTKDSNNAWGGFSGGSTFTTHVAGAPINLTPTGNEAVSPTPTFYGEQATSSDNITSYDIIVYSDDLASTLWTSGTLSTGITGGTSFSKAYAGSALTANVFYQYKVRVTSSIGGTSAYSALQRFVIVDATVPSLSAPVGTNAYTITPTMTGSRLATFDHFKYEVYPGTSTSLNLGTPIYQPVAYTTTIAAGGLGFQFTKVYDGPALSYNTTYKWRAQVSADAGATYTAWSGLASFTTDAAATPTLTSVGGVSQVGLPWITDSTPDFIITRNNSETIDKMQVLVSDAGGTVPIWDSTMTDVTNATTGTITYAGPLLTPGTTYTWTARYQKTTGPIGSYAPPVQFRLNGAPLVPGNMFPTPGYTYPDTNLPYFEATFGDPELDILSDYPTAWSIVIELADGTPVTTKTISAGLVPGTNSYQWTGGDVALSYSTDYRVKMRFTDSKSAAGTYSGYHAFRMATSPNGTIITPSNGSVLSKATPDVTWSFTGGTQQTYTIDIDLMDDNDPTVKVKNVTTLGPTVSASTLKVIPAGFLLNFKYFRITLTVSNTDGLYDPSPSSVTVLCEFNPPNPIVGLSATTDDPSSLIRLDWRTATMKTSPNQDFVAYYIYKRLPQDEDWQFLDSVTDLSHSYYNDWYAGHGVVYQYRVTCVVTQTGVGIEMESPDDPDGGSFCTAILDTDVWMFVGNDRADQHITYLPVSDESHERIVQQEAFETLGSNRKVIIRGFVLGNEGSITCLFVSAEVPAPWDAQISYPETIFGRRIIDYLTVNKGPHILKSPFGDVWDSEFAGPKYQWVAGGNLQVDLSWVETGLTSLVSI